MVLEVKYGNEVRSYKWLRFGFNVGENIGNIEGNSREVNLWLKKYDFRYLYII